MSTFSNTLFQRMTARRAGPGARASEQLGNTIAVGRSRAARTRRRFRARIPFVRRCTSARSTLTPWSRFVRRWRRIDEYLAGHRAPTSSVALEAFIVGVRSARSASTTNPARAGEEGSAMTRPRPAGHRHVLTTVRTRESTTPTCCAAPSASPCWSGQPGRIRHSGSPAPASATAACRPRGRLRPGRTPSPKAAIKSLHRRLRSRRTPARRDHQHHRPVSGPDYLQGWPDDVFTWFATHMHLRRGARR